MLPCAAARSPAATQAISRERMTGERVGNTPPPSPPQPHAADVARAAEKPVFAVKQLNGWAQKSPPKRAFKKWSAGGSRCVKPQAKKMGSMLRIRSAIHSFSDVSPVRDSKKKNTVRARRKARSIKGEENDGIRMRNDEGEAENFRCAELR